MMARDNEKTNPLRALLLALALAAPNLHAADGSTVTAPGFGFEAPGPEYHEPASLFSTMGTGTRLLVDQTMQNLRIFNQRLAHSLDQTEFRMTAAELPAPENWDYEYWDYVKEPKSFVMPTEDGGLLFEFQFKY